MSKTYLKQSKIGFLSLAAAFITSDGYIHVVNLMILKAANSYQQNIAAAREEMVTVARKDTQTNHSQTII